MLVCWSLFRRIYDQTDISNSCSSLQLNSTPWSAYAGAGPWSLSLEVADLISTGYRHQVIDTIETDALTTDGHVSDMFSIRGCRYIIETQRLISDGDNRVLF